MPFKLNPITGKLDLVNASGGGSGSSNSFETISTPAGTSPVADSATDTLTLLNGAGISITGNSTTDEITIASTITQYTDELAQDAIGTILVDSSTIDFTYNDGTPSITASVIQSAIDHGSIGGLADDDHTQYMLNAVSAVQDNRIARIDGTTGRLIQTSGISIDDTAKMTWATSGSDIFESGGQLIIDQTSVYFGTTTDSATHSVGVGRLSINELIASDLRLKIGDNTSTDLQLADMIHIYTGGYSGTPANTLRTRLDYTGDNEEIYQTGLIVEVENNSGNGGGGGPDTTGFFQRGILVRCGMDPNCLPLDSIDSQMIGVDVDVGYFGGGPTHVGGELSIFGIMQRTLPVVAGIAERRFGAYFNNIIGLPARNSIRFDSTENDTGDTLITKNTADELEFDVDAASCFLMSSTENKSELPLRVSVGATATATYARVGGMRFVDVTPINSINGTIAGQSHSLPADSLNADGDSLMIRFAGTYAANANNKTINIQVGGVTALTTGAVAHNGGSWTFIGEYVRTGAATGAIYGTLTRRTAAGATTTISLRFATASAHNAAIVFRCQMVGTVAADMVSTESAIYIFNGV